MPLFMSGLIRTIQRISQIGLLMTISTYAQVHALVVIPDHPIQHVLHEPLKLPNANSPKPNLHKHHIAKMRIMHIDLDYVFDSDKAQQKRNIQALIQRINAIQPNTIFFAGFCRPRCQWFSRSGLF